MEKKSIGDVISTNRRKQNLTQRALAAQLNVSDKAVSKWERDISRPDISLLPKLAQILNISVTELLDLPEEHVDAGQCVDHEVFQDASDEVLLSEGEYQNIEKRRREHLHLLIIQGIGALLGAIIVITSGYDLLRVLAGFVVMPLSCAGILRLLVRTFQVVRMKLGYKIYDGAGNYYIVPKNGLGIIGSVIALGLFTSIFTGFARVENASEIILLLMGIIEVFLLYRDIVIVRTFGFGRVSLKVAIVFSAIVLVLSSIIAVMWFSSAKDTDIETDVTQPVVMDEYQGVDASLFSPASSSLKDICEVAANYVLAEENKQREYNHEIVIPSSLKGAYFLSAKDPGVTHYDVGSGTYIRNAIIVIGHYNVNIANTAPRDEWVVCVFPNILLDDSGTPRHSAKDEYCDYMQSDSLDDVYVWICQEYYDMDIITLELPQM